MDNSMKLKRNEILQKHNDLQDELNRLSNSNDLMTRNEWKKNEDRIQSIKLEIDNLKAQEKLYEDEPIQPNVNNFGLKMLTTKEVLELLHCSEPTLKNWVNIGMLNPIKIGKSFLFIQSDIYEFQQTYKGCDISNYEKALIEYERLNN